MPLTINIGERRKIPMGKFSLKRMAILVMAVVMMFAMTIPASAATSSNTEGSNSAAAKAKITKTVVPNSLKKLNVTYSGTNAAKYKVAYKKDGAKKWTYKTVTSKTFSISVKKGGLYQVKVAGINKDGTPGKYSAIKYRYINGSKAVTKGKKKAIKVTAKKAKNITGYRIYYSTSKSMKGQKVVTVKTTKKLNKTIKKLKKGTYYVQVRPYKVKGGKTYVGVSLNTKKVTVK